MPFMRERGFSFVTAMIMAALIALAVRFAAEQFIAWSISQNEANAVDTLKLISTAIENYAGDHLGLYPTNLTALCESKPAYIERSYTKLSAAKGYVFECPVLDPTGYACQASPLRCKTTGKTVYRITTGGSRTDQDCGRKR